MTNKEFNQMHTYYTVLARVHYRGYRANLSQNKPLSARVQKVMFIEAMSERRRVKAFSNLKLGPAWTGSKEHKTNGL
jgi:hypothetical protein